MTILLAAMAGCGGHQDLGSNSLNGADGGADAAPCISPTVTGELVDFESSDTAFAGVGNATFTEHGGSVTDVSSANGQFGICVESASSYVFDVDMPADRIDALAYIEAEAQVGIVPLSLRSLTATRAASFYAEHGLAFDATKAHAIVQLTGDRSDVTLDRPHDTTLATGGSAGTFVWDAGPVGRYVLFPNVDVTSPTGQLSGDTSGPHTIPLAAGTLTLVAINWVVL